MIPLRIFTVLCALLLLSGQACSAQKESPACMCDPEALHQAVLDRIFESGIGHKLYHFSGEKITFETLSKDQIQINLIWTYSKKLTDHCLRDAYASWASYYQNEHDDSLESLKHPKAVEPDTYAEEKKKKDREIEECKRKGIVPRLETGAMNP